jgi:hypothetical protein
MYRTVRFSPDGKYVLVSFVKTPFSYLVPYYRFPTETHVYDLQANLIKVISVHTSSRSICPRDLMLLLQIKEILTGEKILLPSLYYV